MAMVPAAVWPTSSVTLRKQDGFRFRYTNCITAKSFRMALLPLYGNSDKDAIEMAMAHAFLTDPNQAKIVRIKNTLKLEDIECSVSCLEDIKKRSGHDNHIRTVYMEV